MSKKWVKFLLVVVLCLMVESFVMLWCYNSYVNENKVEKGSVFVNLANGWKSFSNTEEEPIDLNEYVEPSHEIYIAIDVHGKVHYGYEVGEKYYVWNPEDMYNEDGSYKEDYEPGAAKDKNGNDMYVKESDKHYYATSTNSPDTYMYVKKIGDPYFAYATDGNIEFLENSEGGQVISGPKIEIPKEDVTFAKNAKFYYLVVLGSGVLSISSIIGLIIVAILNKKSSPANLINNI